MTVSIISRWDFALCMICILLESRNIRILAVKMASVADTELNHHPLTHIRSQSAKENPSRCMTLGLSMMGPVKNAATNPTVFVKHTEASL